MNIRVLMSWLCWAGVVTFLTGSWLSPAFAGEALDKPAVPAKPPDSLTYDVVVKPDLTYYDGAEADRNKHQLDLYLPKGKTAYPVVMFVHGGSWIFGDRAYFGIYEGLGKMFARHGIGAVVISYRLSPGVRHPDHIKDVARAFAWTHKHIAEYGGRPDDIFLCGHSAGGHLVSLLATDESYLKAEGLSLKDVKAVMSISGVYRIPDNMFNEVFGKDPVSRKNAGPINHVHEGCPPFLVIYADHDFPSCDAVSEEFGKALKAKDVSVETLKISDRTHLDIITNTRKDDDPCAKALVKFVARRQAKE